MSITRRDFLAQTGSLSSLLVLSYAVPAWAAPGTELRLSQRAHRGTTFEGNWQPPEIEGALPPDLRGTLFRIGPGAKVAQGRALTHFFDGDGLVTSLRIENGQVSAQSRFVETEERTKEQTAGRMLYHEFGTAAGPIARGYKNSPNIHLMPLPEGLLALSEASHPTLLNPTSLESAGTWNFAGSLPGNTTFTAHPKRDPKTADIYSFGMTRALSPELRMFKMPGGQGPLQQIGSVNLGGFYPTHDMLMTDHYLIFVVSPVKINLLKAATLHWPISEILEYETEKPLRIFVAPKDGSTPVIEIESSPSGLIFHHINAFESDDGKTLSFHSIVQEDASAYEIFKAWSAPNLPSPPKSWITKFTIDLPAKSVIAREKISDGGALDFPCLDPALISSDVRCVHLLESSGQDCDPLSFDRLACWDLHDGTSHRIQAPQGQTLGEPIFVPHASGGREQDGWLLMLGYDSTRDQTFLEIRSPMSLEFITRVWLQRYVPLGFHGFFQRAGDAKT